MREFLGRERVLLGKSRHHSGLIRGRRGIPVKDLRLLLRGFG